MVEKLWRVGALIALVGAIAVAAPRVAWSASAQELAREGAAAVKTLRQRNLVAEKLAPSAKGILVFPNILKAGFLFGGQIGEGVLYNAAMDSAGTSSSEQTRRFTASRLTAGNFLFPTIIDVDPIRVLKIKRSWFTSDEESISITHVASVRIQTGILFSDIWIESSGGTNQITSHGHSKADAQEIKRLIELHQRAFAARGR